MIIEPTIVYEKTVDAENYRIVCHQGGSRSSKSWSIFQYFLFKALEGEEFILTIVRDKMTWIKSTILKDFEELIKLTGATPFPEINPNRQEQVYSIGKAEFAFFGLDYPAKLHGRKQTYVWINEAMEVSKEAFDQLEMRTDKQVILDFNPYDDEHWIFDLALRDDVVFIKSTQLDNPFLPEAVRKKILSYEPTPENIKAGTADEYMWQVYGLGNKAKLRGAIFSWDMKEIPEEAKLLARGMDFGYTNDPTTLIDVYTCDNEIYLDELIYETGLNNQEIVARIESLGIDKGAEVIADSSEPKSINEISNGGINIRGAKKGADSIRFGIDLLKSYKVHYSPRSVHIESESRKYKWGEDKNGKNTRNPVDAFNHCIDPVRYVALEKLGSSAGIEFFETTGL